MCKPEFDTREVVLGLSYGLSLMESKREAVAGGRKVCQQSNIKQTGSNSIPRLSQEYFVLYLKKENGEVNIPLAIRSGGKTNINLYRL